MRCHIAGGNCRLFGIDSWAGDIHMGDYGGDSVYSDLSTYISDKFPSATLVREKFEDAAKTVDNNCVDLLHIDGLHTYDAVKQDFETWREKILCENFLRYLRY